MQHHKGQMRASGEPYIIHPLEVAEVLAEMKLDATAIAAGLLHDAVEDTPATSEEIEADFGDQVAHIVEGVTKIDKIQFANREDRQAENVRKMLLAMVTDVRVVLIKLADRLHNMRTLEHLQPDRQEAIARETLDIYAPLAHRLGMGKVRGELEDLAFRYTDPVSFEQVVRSRRGPAHRGRAVPARRGRHPRRATSRKQHRGARGVAYQAPLLHLPEAERIQGHFRPGLRSARRPRHYPGCGLLLRRFRPHSYPVAAGSGRIKDFIAIPRANRYQSLHTTVIGEGGHQFEVQIRTEEMHRIAEEGIAAHWKYKAGGGAVTARDEERLNWIRQLVEWQKEMTDPNEFLSSLKMDLYPDEVYTFTPKGKVVVVPADGTPVDFAYTIHTEVGHTCVGAKVNGRMVPLRTKLRTGDIVEIVTQKDHKPSRDWLTFVKSPRARNKIKHWLNEDQRRRAVEIGRKLLEREARRFKVPMSQIDDQDLGRIAGEYGVATAADLLATLGPGKHTAHQVLNKLAPGYANPPDDHRAQSRSRLALSSRPCPTRCASCTSPAPIRSRLKARMICSSIARDVAIPSAAKRLSATLHAAKASPCTRAVVPTCRTCSTRAIVESTWSGHASAMIPNGRTQRYPVKITVFCDDRTGMLKELTAVISDDNTNIRGVDIHHDDNGEAVIEFVVEAEDLRHLNRMVLGIRRVQGVRTVQRTQKL